MKANYFSELLYFSTLEDFRVVYSSANTSNGVFQIKMFLKKVLANSRKIFEFHNHDQSKLLIISIKQNIYEAEYSLYEGIQVDKLLTYPKINSFLFSDFQKAQEDDLFLDEISISNSLEFLLFKEIILPKLALDTFSITTSVKSSVESCSEIFKVE